MIKDNKVKEKSLDLMAEMFHSNPELEAILQKGKQTVEKHFAGENIELNSSTLKAFTEGLGAAYQFWQMSEKDTTVFEKTFTLFLSSVLAYHKEYDRAEAIKKEHEIKS